MYDKLSSEPIILNHNRIKRAYTGGMLLDRWQGIGPASDGSFSEEFLISTVEVTNANKMPGEGLSKTTLENGAEITLKEIIDSNPGAFLGEKYCRIHGNEVGVLARAGDSKVRLVIQAHPDNKCARKYLDFPNGKTEAWYIVDSREIEGEKPHVYAGFKPGVTRKVWEELFEKQDIQGMLDAMHKLYVKQGDVILIEAGMPHAMGPGSLFLEVHEPSDYTLRLERNYSTGRVFTDQEIHYGMGFEKMFDCFHYKTYTRDEIQDKIFIQSFLLAGSRVATEYDLVTYKHTSRFAMRKIVISKEYRLAAYDGHRIAIVIEGNGKIEFGSTSKKIRSGQGIFLPAGLKEPCFKSDNCNLEVVIVYPPES